jgi:hypothetical protein
MHVLAVSSPFAQDRQEIPAFSSDSQVFRHNDPDMPRFAVQIMVHDVDGQVAAPLAGNCAPSRPTGDFSARSP